MFNLKNPFKSKEEDQKITSLNLQPPDVATTANAKQASPPGTITDTHLAVLREQPVPEEINSGIRQLLDSGAHPEAVFLAQDPRNRGLIVFKHQNPPFQAIPLFSSPFLVGDYLRATKTVGQVIGVKMESLPQVAQSWRDGGIDSFLFNRCPRCPIVQPLRVKDNLITAEQIRFMWATQLTIRNWRARKLIRQYLDYAGDDSLAQKRTSLEFLRDHVAYDVPYVHWMIALIAGMQGDKLAHDGATASLEEFGPDFVGKTDNASANEFAGESDRPKAGSWSDSMAKAHIGLLMSFRMLNPSQEQRPVG
jgi:hypothetical protein